MKYLWLVLIVFLCACEKSIDVQPGNQHALLVVDGMIENGKNPYIVLSNSLNYFSKINPEILAASLVTNAALTLSDGSRTVALKEYVQPLGGGYQLNYYSSDTTNPVNAMVGELGKTYTLNISYNNLVYSSVTTIPAVAKTVDSIWWKPAPFDTGTSRVVLMARVTDPPGYGNYIRYFTRVNNEVFLPGANSANDDQVTDGTTYDVQVEQGINRNDPPDGDEYGFFHYGDTITVKLANIDKASFDFWRTLEFSYQSVGNPFSTPVKVLGNVSNGALGGFCGYGAEYKSLIIPK